MKYVTLVVAFHFVASLAHAAACLNAPLTTYTNNGPYTCTEGGGSLTVDFNNTILPSYVGLNLLSSNNNSANPADITAVPGNLGFQFDSSDFSENSILLSSQAELVHFFLDGGSNPITETTLSLNDAETSAGIGLGTGLIVGQELVCVGGTFTSLPTGLVTSVANGVLGTGEFGCNGTVVVGTAADSSGPLSAITSALGLPDLTGLTDEADIQLSPYNATKLDIIKLHALVSITGGSASDTSFGNTYTQAGSATPEPGSGVLLFGGGFLVLLYKCKWFHRKQ